MAYLFYYIPQAPNKKWVNANKAENIQEYFSSPLIPSKMLVFEENSEFLACN